MARKKFPMQNILKKWDDIHSSAKQKDQRTTRHQQNNRTQQGAYPQTRRVRNIKKEIIENDAAEENIDAEAALYIKKLQEDWANINQIAQQTSTWREMTQLKGTKVKSSR